MSELVTFRLGDSRFAIPAEVVTEIVEAGPIAHALPGAQSAHLRLARVRDRWMPVLELASALDDVPCLDAEAQDAMLLVLGQGKRRLGLRVQGPGEVIKSGVEGVRRVRSDGLIELDGELLRYVDPAALVAGGPQLFGEKGEPMGENRAEPRRLVTFQLDGEEFAIDVMKVFEVLPVPEIRSVPKAPDFVEGVVELRGSIVPVIDMRKRFSLPQRESDAAARLLVAAVGDQRAGLVVDAVPGVIPLPEDEVDPPPDFFRGLAGRYLEGLAKVGDRLIILLDIGEILSSKEKIALEKMMASASSASDETGGTTGRKKKKGAARRSKKKPKKRTKS